MMSTSTNNNSSHSSLCSNSMQAPFKRPVLDAVVSLHIICTWSSRFQSSSASKTALAWAFPEELSSFGTARSSSFSSNDIRTGSRSSLGLLTSKPGNNLPSQWTVITSGTRSWKSVFISNSSCHPHLRPYSLNWWFVNPLTTTFFPR